jgi:acyl-CoA thioesterase-1
VQTGPLQRAFVQWRAPAVRRSALIAGCALAAIGLAACQQERGERSASEQTNEPGDARSVDTKPVASRRKTILFAGTSLTAGYGLEPDSAYPQLLQRKIDADGLPFEAVNSGVSGETSAGLLRRLDWILQSDADVMVIETGANDGLRGIPAETLRENLDQILTRVRAAKPDTRILLVQMEVLPNLGARYARAFHEVFVDLAKKHEVTLLPFLLEGVAGTSALNQPDGVHPNLEGERRVAENVWKGLRPVLVDRGR